MFKFPAVWQLAWGRTNRFHALLTTSNYLCNMNDIVTDTNSTDSVTFQISSSHVHIFFVTITTTHVIVQPNWGTCLYFSVNCTLKLMGVPGPLGLLRLWAVTIYLEPQKVGIWTLWNILSPTPSRKIPYHHLHAFKEGPDISANVIDPPLASILAPYLVSFYLFFQQTGVQCLPV